MQPDTYLFDIGNVIICFDFNRAARRIQDRCTATPEAILPLIEPLAVPFERGELSVEEFVGESSERIGFSGEAREFIDAFADIFTLNQPIADLVVSLERAGHPLYLLSNTNAIHEPFFTREWAEVFGCFHGAIYSHEVGHMKPDPEIFRIAIERLDLEPERTIYLDDREENIVAGAGFGLRAIRYDHTDHETFKVALGRLG